MNRWTVKRLLAERDRLERELAQDARVARLKELTDTLRVLGQFDQAAQGDKAEAVVRQTEKLIRKAKKAPKTSAAILAQQKERRQNGPRTLPVLYRILQANPAPVPTERLKNEIVAAGGVRATDPSPSRTIGVVLGAGRKMGRFKETPEGWRLTAKGSKAAAVLLNGAG